MTPFRERYNLEARIADRMRAVQRRPKYIPTIVERGNKEAPPIDREKYMVPFDITGAQMIYIIRRRMQLGSSQTLFLLCDKRRMITATDSMGQLYDKFRDPQDGFLYVTYSLENAFGSTNSQLTNDLP